MKVICIKAVRNLTLHKIYEVEWAMGPGGDDEYHNNNLIYYLIDDSGDRNDYKMKYFTTLGALREQRINEILE